MDERAVIRLAVFGAHGRMGRRIVTLASAVEHLEIAAKVTRETPLDSGPVADVIIDFSTPEGTREAARHAAASGAALLVGTTGLSVENLRQLDGLADSNAVMVAANTAPGVVVLGRLVEVAARCLADFDIEMMEHHHAAKRDAPSGTARRLADVIGAARGKTLDPDRIHAMRGGEIPGDHRIFFAGPGELLDIGHRALSRDVFAHGALRAARWLAGRPAGRYPIEAVYESALGKLTAGGEPAGLTC